MHHRKNLLCEYMLSLMKNIEYKTLLTTAEAYQFNDYKCYLVIIRLSYINYEMFGSLIMAPIWIDVSITLHWE